ncbi:MAG: ATP-binding protein [Thermodesulfobacteriota bacterium]
MYIPPIGKQQKGIPTSPWIILGAVAILFVILMALAVRNTNRERAYVSRILMEKGAALIRSFEAGARTGMMRMQWGEPKIQMLLEETARQSDIVYLVITDADGTILAHNDPGKIGRRLFSRPELASITPGDHEKWRLAGGGAARAFEVYRYFRPMCRPMRWFHGKEGFPGSHKGLREGAWCLPPRGGGGDRIIFVGLDISFYEEARREDLRNTVLISGVLLALGFGGFLSLFWAHNYRLARRSLQDTSAFANELVSHLPVGLVAVGPDGRIAFLNTAAESIMACKSEAMAGRDPDTVFPGVWREIQKESDQGRDFPERETVCRFGGDDPVPLGISASRIVNDDGLFIGMILILRDLGEVRRLQEEIRRQEKLAAVGHLAAGIAHEIRNPLSSIKGLATYFGGKFAEGSDDHRTAEVMVREVERLNRVISQLLEFARPADLKRRPTDLNAVVEHALQLVGGDVQARGVSVQWRPDKSLASVSLDPDRLSQCLLNLFLNAIQAMEAGGVLSVAVSGRGNREIVLEVADSGHGISRQDLPRIFDPYFTTKPSGTGLGLAIVHKIIEAHQGRVQVHSTEGAGTVIRLMIPYA